MNLRLDHPLFFSFASGLIFSDSSHLISSHLISSEKKKNEEDDGDDHARHEQAKHVNCKERFDSFQEDC